MSDLRILRLEEPSPAPFLGMTFPVYRHLLDLRPGARHPEQADPRRIQPLAFGAWAGEAAVGLLLAEAPTADAQTPEILSLFVVPEARGRGVATALVAALEAELARLGFAAVQAVYTTGRPGSEAVERLLRRRGWSAPQTRTVLVQFHPGRFLQSDLLSERRVRALDPGFEIFSWADLPALERAALQESDERKPWVTPGLAAWKFDREGYDPVTSIGARYRGEVVGWVLTQRIHATAVRYLASFLRKDLSRRGRILPLYRASLARADAHGCELATFVTPVIYPTMIRFIHRWLAPHMQLVAETRGSILPLSGLYTLSS